MHRLSLVVGALLLAIAARAQPPADWSKAEQVSMLMLDNRFVPDRLALRHGVAYRLNLENRGKDLHEFTAPGFFANAIVRDPGVLANAGTDVVVRPGAVVDLYLAAMRPGTFPLICADHDWDGMVGEIIVE